MTPRDMVLWEQFYQLEPWGPSQQALGLGTIAAILANQRRKRGQTAAKASDLYPSLERAARRGPKEARREAAKVDGEVLKCALERRRKAQRERRKGR